MSTVREIKVGNVNYNAGRVHYGTCKTAAATVAKVVSCPTFTADDLIAGAAIIVKNTTANSGAVGSLTLDVNSTGAKSIKKLYNGAINNITAVGEFAATSLLFVYDGTYWVLANANYNNTYGNMSQDEATAGTSTTQRVITAKVLNDTIANKIAAIPATPVATTTTNGLMAAADKVKLNGIAAGAEVNQNAFSNIKVGNTTVAADTKTDTVEFAGSNVTITPDATNDKVTFGITKANVTTALGFTPANATAAVTNVAYDSTNKKITKTVNGTTSDVVTVATLKSALSLAKADVGLGNVDNTADANKNVNSAKTLTTGRAIDGVTFNGSAAITHYGTCETAAATAAKAVACTSYTLVTGSRIIVKFTVTNTAANPTLNVNSTGAKAIQYRGAAISAGYLAANRTYEFIYDGTNYQLVGDLDTNTTYTFTADNPTLAWGTTSKIGTIGGTEFKVTLPANPNTDTKVTSAANHYAPATVSGQDKTASASGATAAWSIDVVKGITVNTDGKGHITGLSVTSGKIPGNPNTDTKVTQTVNTTNALYPVLAKATTTTTTATEGTSFDTKLLVNHSTGRVITNGTASSSRGTAVGFDVQSGGNQLATLWGYSVGSTTAVGWGGVALGNDKATGTAGNARGYIYLYGTGSGYTQLDSANTGSTNYTVHFPNITGTVGMLEGTQTFRGEKTFSSKLTVNNVLVGKAGAVTAGNYTTTMPTTTGAVAGQIMFVLKS